MMPTGGAVASGGFEDGGDLFFDLGFVGELELHDLADFGGLGAVDGEHEGLFEEGIVDGGEVGVEGDDAVFAGLVGELDDLGEDGFAVLGFMEEDLHEGLAGGDEDAEGELEHDGSGGSADDDHGGGGLGDLTDVSAFDHHAGEDADKSENESADAGDVHEELLLFALCCGADLVRA